MIKNLMIAILALAFSMYVIHDRMQPVFADAPLTVTYGEEIIGAGNLCSDIQSKVGDGYNHISLLNPRIEEVGLENELVAVVLAAKESDF